jgi:hypothetical protein
LVYRVAGKMSSNNIKCNTTLKAKNSVVFSYTVGYGYY